MPKPLFSLLLLLVLAPAAFAQNTPTQNKPTHFESREGKF